MDPRKNKLDAFLSRPQKEGIPEDNGEQALEDCDSAGLSFNLHPICHEINLPYHGLSFEAPAPSFG